ncbi:hypothetical protein [Streptomyces omiyaensis]|uniref:hypothetical protein n=1 Tax=Streptomyces omiyaensis TaxID=68247 RepID=UPI003701A799
MTLRFTATLPEGVRGPVSAALHLPHRLDGAAGDAEVSDEAVVSTCAVGGVAYGPCPWKWPYNDMGLPFDPPSLALPTAGATATLAYAVTLDADETAVGLGSPDASSAALDVRVELKDGTGAVVAQGPVLLSFVPGTPPARERGTLHARDRSGVLWRYEATGVTSRPFERRKRVGGGWNAYDTMTTLDSPNGALARDAAGVLWKHDVPAVAPAPPFTPKQRLQGDWKRYTALVGTGELGRDRSADLVARDASGQLWLHQGRRRTGPAWNPSLVPDTARTPVGGGWNVYDLLV